MRTKGGWLECSTEKSVGRSWRKFGVEQAQGNCDGGTEAVIVGGVGGGASDVAAIVIAMKEEGMEASKQI